MAVILDAPNTPQPIPLRALDPSDENVRLFVERERLDTLVAIYRQWTADPSTILPDAPIVRYRGPDRNLEILAGERRIEAARIAGLREVPCRVVTLDASRAYRFIVEHNHVAGLTTVELAFRAAEMDRLGFSEEEISEALQGASPYRYIDVGRLVSPALFTDATKLCDPSIVEWYEASRFGPEHFHRCFTAWDAGLWDAERCSREFRRRADTLPIDPSERGVRVTYNGNRLVIRGQVNLDYVTVDQAEEMLQDIVTLVNRARMLVQDHCTFGPREVIHVLPTSEDES